MISNDDKGIEKLHKWLIEKAVDLTRLHVCCEATNVYYLFVAKYLYAQKIAISVLNPSVIKYYAKYKLQRVKNDKQDAKLIAQFCAYEQPELWQPEQENKAQLKSLHRRREQLTDLLAMERNRGYVADEYSHESVNKVIQFLEDEANHCLEQMKGIVNQNTEFKRQYDILMSIVGVGEITALALLSILLDKDKFPTVKHLISWLGLSPMVRQSGKYKGFVRLSKMGDKSIRKALYIPARSACTRSKLWRGWFDEKIKTKPAKKVYVLMMVKIVKYAYYCLKYDKPFNPNLHRM